MKSIAIWAGVFREWLQHPIKVFIVVASFAFGAVLVDGTLFRLWSLSRDQERLEKRLDSLKASIQLKEKKVLESNRPDFIERQAREQLDLVRDGDLVFVFADASDGTSGETLEVEKDAAGGL